MCVRRNRNKRAYEPQRQNQIDGGVCGWGSFTCMDVFGLVMGGFNFGILWYDTNHGLYRVDQVEGGFKFVENLKREELHYNNFLILETSWGHF